MLLGSLCAAQSGCNSLLGIKDAPVRESEVSCLRNSDCPALDQVCLFKTCSPSCAADRDCTSGARCLATEQGTACVSAAKASCTEHGSECPSGSECRAGACTTRCGDDLSTCLEDQMCIDGGCQKLASSPDNSADGSGIVAEVDAAIEDASSLDAQSNVRDANASPASDAGPDAMGAAAAEPVCTPHSVPTQCSNNVPQYCNSAGQWQSGTACAAGSQCVSGSCTCSAGAFCCQGDALLKCNDNGVGAVPTACPAGCDAALGRCKKIVPSNALGTAFYAAALDWTVTDGTVIDTGTGTGQPKITPPVTPLIAVVAQSNGPEIAVLALHSIKIPAGATLRVKGGRALALLAATTIDIGGVLDASSSYDNDCGPAANTGCAPGERPTWDAMSWGCGSNGGGHATAGGRGADASGQGCYGRTPSVENCTNTALVPLLGGSNGGDTNDSSPEGYTLYGGCGGGALQFVAGTSIAISGALAASGGGGGYERRIPFAPPGVYDRTSSNFGGAGGGSGGAILLEAPLVTLSGKLFVNGGGGSGGSVQTSGVNLAPGANGAMLSAPAPATAGIGSGSGSGGVGAAGSSEATDALPYSTTVSHAPAGGGGGGAGRIRINDGSSTITCQMQGPFSPNLVGVTSCGAFSAQ